MTTKQQQPLFFRIIYGAFIAAVIAIALLLATSALPIPGNYKIKIVQSGSMEPGIPTGSIVVIRPNAAYVIGDVITFGKDTKKDIPTTHRIMELRTQEGNYFYTTKGDANNAPDAQEVAANSVIGKVLFHVPFVGFLLDFAKKPIGFVVLIVLPAAMIILDELRTIWIEVRKRKTVVADKDDNA